MFEKASMTCSMTCSMTVMALMMSQACGFSTVQSPYQHTRYTSSAATTKSCTTSSSLFSTTEIFSSPELPKSTYKCCAVGKKQDAWEVHKFGGASLATAELYKTVGDLLISESKQDAVQTVPTMGVVSARGGMTDLLVKVVDSALLDFEAAELALSDAVETQIAVLRELVGSDESITAPIEETFRNDANDILSVVQSLRLLQTVPSVTMEVVTGFGEIWSAATLAAYLETRDQNVSWLDARKVLVVDSDSGGLGEKGEASTGGVTPLWDITATKLDQWWSECIHSDAKNDAKPPIVVVTGFVASTSAGVPTTLKRSGSDYSATIFAKLVSASRVTMWKNTNGVYTADPRAVPEAFPIASLK